MPDKEPTMPERREKLVAILRENGAPLSDTLANAFLTVPRHLFVPGVYLDAVYADNKTHTIDTSKYFNITD